ncbi:PfaD family polyunsaturated fatty acid/polyketide biosynthesis protein [Streptomyces sp. NBC_00878]|uniref:PfaD family polyunsaturated fatty acid/polyketide biosynthesis protein n=1 Tax=Streptomyces sp. NBC_00878 TaxID=2975854 RepID=UPI00225202EA|nr:PfaD family polyunsaturated fatty acid/polyketide biosynthesis protein [Streptomyces sp. NBC_00878]MCX4903172.1 PfaD family polyunsaturated fatty acid/polyketide biosynthesis protein [Streptomyces sp. NBC_00878]
MAAESVILGTGTPTGVRGAQTDDSGSAEWAPAFSDEALVHRAQRIREPAHIVQERSTGRMGLAPGTESARSRLDTDGLHRILGTLPPQYPEWLGDLSFGTGHGARFPYVGGEMANGIATTRMVVVLAQAGMVGFFGAGGLDHRHVEQAVAELQQRLGDRRNWGVNLIHSPQEPGLEERVAGLLVTRGVPAVSASAYMSLTPAVVRCSVSGLSTDPSGEIVRRTRMFAKVSRPEVAEQFMSPAPPQILRTLLERGEITEREADLAAHVPVAADITVEADSGGHTDNRPLAVLLPVLLAMRTQLTARFGYRVPLRVGAAGGLGTPEAVASAFAMGAAYVVTGSINQVSTEAGLSDEGKGLLGQADVADVTMAPSSDMFELGVKLQVLRRGTMFAARANQLYEVYRSCESLEGIPPETRTRLERDVLRGTIEESWSSTRRYWQDRDPGQLDRAERDPKHRMALLFRSYLGQSSRWAITGETGRRTDYQIWCGPAMGAFNRWTRDSFLARSENRSVVQIALNLLEGAAVITRAHQLRSCGVPLPAAAFSYRPRPLA